MFDFLNPLTPDDFNQQTEFLIEGFLPKHLITMIYADGGMGKSWAAMGIAKFAEQSGMDVLYLDYDNPMSILKERGVENNLIKACPNLRYVHRSKTPMQALEMLTALEEQAIAGRFKNTLIVLDSMRDFSDVNNDSKAMALGEKLKNLREAGATILALHHSTKNGGNYQGSNNIRNSIDNMYQLTKIDGAEDEIRWILTVKKERAPIVDTALSIKPDTFEILPIDIETARLSPEEKQFIEAVKAILIKSPGINKKELLEAMDYDKRDKTANNRLDQFEEIYWQSEKIKNVYHYSLTES
ncbi:hypothetical protein AVO42_00380 [Thiomicrospira sp. XS5]|uniref:AAA family ATPase n=1 Tax=Thiomicrospira sp. XS5 TaxID=1775636 RepID=UPI00074810F8|nr:AAA family ATPase [Thiomicrospira sp. XS5]KUJ73912.1 hypothetical protein AVO42_00380 [Thiomicrospira sp. XS5]